MSQVGTETGFRMVKWQKATATDRRVLEAILIVLRRYPYLIDFMFDPEEPRLRQRPEDLLEESASFSSGEDLLVRVALDLWSGSGDAHVWELIEFLDDENFSNVAEAFQKIGTKFNGWDGPVMRQLKTESW